MCYALSCSAMSDSFAAPWTLTHQPPLSMEFSSQEYWSGLPFPTPWDLPDPGIALPSLTSPALAGRFFTTVKPGKPQFSVTQLHNAVLSAVVSVLSFRSSDLVHLITDS